MWSADSVNRWFAVQVRPHHERTVCAMLEQKGYEQFLPVYRPLRRRSHRPCDEQPLFPGYVFCRVPSMGGRPLIVTTPGVIRVVGYAGQPVPVDDGEIAAIQRIVRTSLRAEPWTFLEEGDRVRLERGPLAGTEGVLVSVKNEHRLVVSVMLLRRAVAVEVDASWVTTLTDSFEPALLRAAESYQSI